MPNSTFLITLLFVWVSYSLPVYAEGVPNDTSVHQSPAAEGALEGRHGNTGDYPEYKDDAIEKRLDAALEVGFYPPNRELFHSILADVDESTPIDTYVRTYSYRAYELLLSDEDAGAAFALAERLLQRTQASPAFEARLEALLAEAQLLLFDNQLTAALSRIAPLEEKVRQARNPRLVFFGNHLIARILQQNSQYEDALNYFLRSYEVTEQGESELDNRRLIFVALHIARIQAELRNDDAAMATTLEAIDMAKQSQLYARLPDLYLVKGFIEGRETPNETALQSYHEAIRWADEVGDNRVRLLGRNNAGSVLMLMERLDDAREVLHDALTLAENIGRQQDTDIIQYNLAYIEVLEGNYGEGIAEMEAATERYREYARQAEIADWLTFMARAYGRAGRYQEQAETLVEQQRLRDEIFRAERDRVVSGLQIRFETQEQNRRIELLRQQSELQEEQLANQRLHQRIVQLIVVVVILAIIILFFAYRTVRRANARLNEANKALHDQSIRDPLTGLLNRRSLQQSMKEHRRLPGEVDAVFLIDIDLFKTVNDKEGHAAGDEVLTTIAERLKRVCRDSDLVVRWGGEEFLIILRYTNAEALTNFSHRLLNAIGERPITYSGQSIHITATAGFVTLPLSGIEEAQFDWERAVQLADMLLYYGKAHGRNQVNGIISIQGPLDKQKEHTLFNDIGHAMKADWVEHVHITGP